jgi:hypothetical protein
VHFNLLVRLINMTQKGWAPYHLSYFLFLFPRLGLVSHKLIFISNNQMREEDL